MVSDAYDTSFLGLHKLLLSDCIICVKLHLSHVAVLCVRER